MAGSRDQVRPAARGAVAAPSRPRGQAPVAMQAQPAVGVFTNKTVTITVAVSFALMAALAAIVVLSSLFVIPPQAAVVLPTPTLPPTATAVPFDPSVGAPLPNNRLILDYGIAYSQIDHNGPASIHPFTFLPALQQLGQQWTTADPKHPAKLGLDLVVNVVDPCQDGVVSTCSHNIQPSIIQAYIDYCQQHGLYLFLDMQFGRATIPDVMSSFLPYFEKYSFVEPAMDTEFHFYSTTQGRPSQDAGYVDAADVNWAIQEFAKIPMQYHVPRKVLLLHEWFDGAIQNINQVKANPAVSVVLHSDGFGSPGDKLVKYQLLVTQEAIKFGAAQYGGFKLFNNYADCPFPSVSGCSGDLPEWTPQDVMNPGLLVGGAIMTPVPLLISYE